MKPAGSAFEPGKDIGEKEGAVMRENVRRIRDFKHLEKVGNIKNIKTFTVTYNRHDGRYGPPVGPNFP